MTQENQQILYNHYVGIATNVIKDSNNIDFKPVIRENCAKHAAEILKNYPAIEEIKAAETEEEAEEAAVDESKDKPKAKGKKAPKEA